MPVDNVLQWRLGTAAEWISVDPTLVAGEAGYETDTGKFKLGDGATAWTALGYANSEYQYGYTGIITPANYAITYDPATRQFTVVSTSDVYVNGVKATPADETTSAHADTTAQYWAVYASGATTLTITTTLDIATQAIAGRIYYNTDQAAAKAIEFVELHVVGLGL